MAKTKVAVTLDIRTLRRVDGQLDRLEHRRLAEECAKLDPAVERAMADEGIGTDAGSWPEHRGAKFAGRI